MKKLFLHNPLMFLAPLYMQEPNCRVQMPAPRPGGGAAPLGVRPTPGQKIMNTGKNFGYSGIKNQQGSTIVIYDSLPLIGSTGTFIFEFFKNVRTRVFPFTNLTENKLQVAESMVIQRMYLSIITVVSDAVTASMELAQAGLDFFYRSDMNFTIANNQVIKPLNVQSFQPQFNYASNWGAVASAFDTDTVVTTFIGNAVWHAETLIVIPPQIEFQANLKVTEYTAVANAYLMLTVEGTAAIMAPRETY